eukprot:12536988-Alexandrium_andersonii.AAC.1
MAITTVYVAWHGTRRAAVTRCARGCLYGQASRASCLRDTRVLLPAPAPAPALHVLLPAPR